MCMKYPTQPKADGTSRQYIRLCAKTGRAGERVYFTGTEPPAVGCFGLKQASASRGQKEHCLTYCLPAGIVALNLAPAELEKVIKELADYLQADHWLLAGEAVSFFRDAGWRRPLAAFETRVWEMDWRPYTPPARPRPDQAAQPVARPDTPSTPASGFDAEAVAALDAALAQAFGRTTPK